PPRRGGAGGGVSAAVFQHALRSTIVRTDVCDAFDAVNPTPTPPLRGGASRPAERELLHNPLGHSPAVHGPLGAGGIYRYLVRHAQAAPQRGLHVADERRVAVLAGEVEALGAPCGAAASEEGADRRDLARRGEGVAGHRPGV